MTQACMVLAVALGEELPAATGECAVAARSMLQGPRSSMTEASASEHVNEHDVSGAHVQGQRNIDRKIGPHVPFDWAHPSAEARAALEFVRHPPGPHEAVVDFLQIYPWAPAFMDFNDELPDYMLIAQRPQNSPLDKPSARKFVKAYYDVRTNNPESEWPAIKEKIDFLQLKLYCDGYPAMANCLQREDHDRPFWLKRDEVMDVLAKHFKE